MKLKTKKEILSRRTPLEKDCFIYFLIKGEEIVYVGQTTNGLTRITQHCADKNFDYYSIEKCQITNLDNLEARYIVEFNPKYNSSTLPKNSIYWPKKKILREFRLDGFAFNRIAKRHGLNPCYCGDYYSINLFKLIFEEAVRSKELKFVPEYSNNRDWFINEQYKEGNST